MQSPNPLRWLVLFGVWAIYGTFGLVATSLAPIVKLIEHDLGMSHSAMGSVMGAWQLAYIAAALPCGVLLDKLGARWTLLLGALLIAGSALWRGLAGSYGELLAAVMLFGAGGPIVSAGAPKVISAWFHGQERGFAMGIYVTGPALGSVVALTLTHAVLLPAVNHDWRALLMVYAVVTALSGVLWWMIASHPGIRPLADARAAADHMPHRALIGGLIEQPAVRLLLAMAVGVFLISHGLSNWLPAMLVHDGMSEVAAGYWSAIPVLVGILGSLAIPRLAVPARRLKILGLLCAAMLGASVLLQFESPAILFPALILQGIARASITTVLILTLVELPTVGARYAGVASGLFFGAGEIGGMLGPTLLGALYDSTGSFTVGLAFFSMVSVGMLAGVKFLRRLA